MALESLFGTGTIAAIVAISVVAGLAHGTIGFGFPVISTPLVALLTDVKTAVLVTVIPNIAVNVISILRGGRWRESIGRHWPVAAAVVAGTLVGTRLLLVAPPEPLKVLLAAMIIVYLQHEGLRRLDWSWMPYRTRISIRHGRPSNATPKSFRRKTLAVSSPPCSGFASIWSLRRKNNRRCSKTT